MKVHVDKHSWYMYYFWIIIVALGAATRVALFMSRTKFRDQYHELISSPSLRPSITRRRIFQFPRAWLKSYLLIPATFDERCSQPYGWCTIPPRIQSLTISLFVVFNLVLCLCSYHLTDGNLYWPRKSTQLLRFVSDRTGIISLANLPLVWLFGMRNDFLMWLTGWGFGTYNAFHRWAARVATLQAVIHSLGYTVMILESKQKDNTSNAPNTDNTRWWLVRISPVLDLALLLERRIGTVRNSDVCTGSNRLARQL